MTAMGLDSQAERVAPPMTQPPRPAIADSERLSFGEDYGYDERPAPVETRIDDGEVDAADIEWAAAKALCAAREREGANFIRLAPDVYVISVRGGQYLHDDRHLADIPEASAAGLNEHSWYLVVEPSETQMLLVEVADGIYEHLPFERDGLLYMNTVNRHMVSRRSPHDHVVLVQVCGYEPHQRDEAVARIRDVLAARPHPIAE
jgi:hypothetical protein